MYSLWSLILFYASISATFNGDTSVSNIDRVRRIVNGSPIQGRTTGYSSVRYFAAVGTLHDQFFPFSFVGKEFAGWHTGVISCGGALITPGIVQTACHCLADFKAEDGRVLQYTKRAPVLFNAWEKAYAVYLGINEENANSGKTLGMTLDNAVKTRKFVIHMSCAKLGAVTQGPVTHDFGWITLDDSWLTNAKIPSMYVDYATLYSRTEWGRLWKYTWEKKPVCLYLGFGRQADESLPKRLMHGWGIVEAYSSCNLKTSRRIPAYDLKNVMTWFCSFRFSKHNQKSGSGDSGGPVACSNYYIGLIQGASYYELYTTPGVWEKEFFVIVNSISFAIFENALEFRADFIRKMEAHSNPDDFIPTFNPPVPKFRSLVKSSQPEIQLITSCFMVMLVIRETIAKY